MSNSPIREEHKNYIKYYYREDATNDNLDTDEFQIIQNTQDAGNRTTTDQSSFQQSTNEDESFSHSMSADQIQKNQQSFEIDDQQTASYNSSQHSGQYYNQQQESSYEIENNEKQILQEESLIKQQQQQSPRSEEDVEELQFEEEDIIPQDLQQQQKNQEQQVQQRQQVQQQLKIQQQQEENETRKRPTKITKYFQQKQQEILEKERLQQQRNQITSHTSALPKKQQINRQLAQQNKNIKQKTLRNAQMAALGQVQKFEKMSEQQKSMEKKQTIEDAYMDRKKESFNNMKEWIKIKEDFLDNHKEVSLQILHKLDSKIQTSIRSMDVIYKFFMKRRDNEIIYCQSLKNNTPQLSLISQVQNQSQQSKNQQKQNKSLQENKDQWYPALTQLLSKTDIVTDHQFKKIEEFAQQLDKNIIKELLEPIIGQYSQGIKNLKQNLNKHQQLLKKQVIVANQKQQKYMQTYKQSVDNTNKQKKDLYNQELKYRKEVYNHLKLVQDYGKYISEMWQQSQKLEKQKLEIIQKSFRIYIEKYTETYGEKKDLEQINKQYATFNPAMEVEKNFSIENILSQEQRENISAESETKNEMTCLNNFLYKFKFPDVSGFDHGIHRLVLKKYQAYKDVGTIGLTWQPIELVFTIDDYLLMFQADDHQNLKKSSSKMICERIALQKREKNNQLENLTYITEKRQGKLFGSTVKVLVKFENADILQEFKFFLERYSIQENM